MSIERLLQQIAYSIDKKEYIWTDPEKVAVIGDINYTAAWHEVCCTLCALLNRRGGTIILGITDDEINSEYIFKGFDEGNEELLRSLNESFTNRDGDTADISKYLRFQLMPFLEGQVLAVYVDAAPEENGYVFYKNAAYERLVTGNSRIPPGRLQDREIKGSPEHEPNAQHEQLEHIPTDEATPAAELVVEEGTITPATELQPEETKATPVVPVQRIYSAELITLFGTDYISLLPDYKQLLSFIYERNSAATTQYPGHSEIAEQLWAIKGLSTGEAAHKRHLKEVKQIIALMEKNGFVLRHSGKQEYKINTAFTQVKNLFN
ncbi:MAG: ATP-binding protein [Taibaiella sp.]|nr:ATP-binding protein [Taibaiella sp.]